MNTGYNPSETSFQNFQSLVESYENTIEEITRQLDGVQNDHTTIGGKIHVLVKENSQLGTDLGNLLEQKSSSQVFGGYQFGDADFVENLKAQLEIALSEKEHVVKLWQNAVETVDYLEGELKIFQDTTQGLVPQAKLQELKSTYEDKLNHLQDSLTTTRQKLEETISLAAKELKIRDREICERLQGRDSSYKIVQNLEEEVLKLQDRLNEYDKTQKVLEKQNRNNRDKIENLKQRNRECILKAEEALQIVEAALIEKDAALLREAAAKEEVLKLSQHLSDVIKECDDKVVKEVNSAKVEFQEKFDKNLKELKASQDEIKFKDQEIANLCKKRGNLESEIEKLHKSESQSFGDNGTSKLLLIEKNLENTFQKLLLSEKQNIQLKSEKDSVKGDLDQMALIYERDVNSREAEKASLKNDIKILRMELDQQHSRLSESTQIITRLNEKIATMEKAFKGQIGDAKSMYDKLHQEKTKIGATLNEYKTQLESQIEINKKWRKETKNITQKLEERLIDLKNDLSRVKAENLSVKQKLKESKQKIKEYKVFLEMISKDVVKITNITLPTDVQSESVHKT